MTKKTRTVIGIIGFGSFGKFLAKKLPSSVDKLVFDKHPLNTAELSELSLQSIELEMLIEKSDVIVLAIPLASYKSVLPAIKKLLRPEQLLIDICSVKIIPEQIIESYFPNHPNLLISHPLFGSRSFDQKGAKNRLIITKTVGELADIVLRYCSEHLGIELIHMSADKHDLLMADIHALTFFVAKALQEFGVKEHEISTPSYKMITDLVNFSASNTDSLLDTIENGNPYAKDVRDKLVETFENLNSVITKSTSIQEE